VRVTTAFKRLMDLSGVTVTNVVFEVARVVVAVKLRSGSCSARSVASQHGPLRHPPGTLHVAASRSGQVAPGGQSGPATAFVPDPWGAHPGGALRPGGVPVHQGLRGPGGVAGHHHGQDGCVSPGAHRLGQRRADYRTRDGDWSRHQTPRPAVRGRRRRGVLAQRPQLSHVGVEP